MDPFAKSPISLSLALFSSHVAHCVTERNYVFPAGSEISRWAFPYSPPTGARIQFSQTPWNKVKNGTEFSFSIWISAPSPSSIRRVRSYSRYIRERKRQERLYRNVTWTAMLSMTGWIEGRVAVVYRHRSLQLSALLASYIAYPMLPLQAGLHSRYVISRYSARLR